MITWLIKNNCHLGTNLISNPQVSLYDDCRKVNMPNGYINVCKILLFITMLNLPHPVRKKKTIIFANYFSLNAIKSLFLKWSIDIKSLPRFMSIALQITRDKQKILILGYEMALLNINRFCFCLSDKSELFANDVR